ncbi:MAG TPA: 5-dehydro-2-deoxygluconokinase [Vicinamibacteria bacterium]|nr:5-dehydro-2-deoxygluconokinase [Vicinamibacteria bacterium]
MEVCVLGRIGYDLYALDHHRPLPRVERFERKLGGSSANMAVGLARLGLRVGMIGALGDDALADYLLGFLQGEAVDTSRVRRVAGYNTSLCLTEVSPPDRFPQVFYRREAADTRVVVGPAELDYVRQAGLFITNGTSLAADPSRQGTLDALEAARAASARTVLDVDYRASSWPSPGEAGRQAQRALRFADVVIGNEDELELLTGARESTGQVRQVLDAGAGLLVRKLGERGVEAHTREGSSFAPPFEVEVASTIGAGDGFAAGFLYALHRGRPLAECLRLGNAAAAVVVSRVGCSDAMPYERELQTLLAANPPARS